MILKLFVIYEPSVLFWTVFSAVVIQVVDGLAFDLKIKCDAKYPS